MSYYVVTTAPDAYVYGCNVIEHRTGTAPEVLVVECETHYLAENQAARCQSGLYPAVVLGDRDVAVDLADRQAEDRYAIIDYR